MKIIVFDNDSVYVTQFERMLGLVLGENVQIVKNPSLNWIIGGMEPFDDTVFFIDTRYKTAGGNFLTLARRIRENSEACHICFLAPSPADIAFCYKKLVRPSGFLLKPVDESELRALLSDITRFEAARRSLPDDPQILLKTRGARTVVRASNILYFTALEKKVVCCTEKEGEIAFYGSLGTLEKRYRDFFLRCHSGFLVNRHRIEAFFKTKMCLRLCGSELEIPVSKSRCREVETYVECAAEEITTDKREFSRINVPV